MHIGLREQRAKHLAEGHLQGVARWASKSYFFSFLKKLHKNCTFFSKSAEKRAFFLFFGQNSVEGNKIEENAQKLAFFREKVLKTRVLMPFYPKRA